MTVTRQIPREKWRETFDAFSRKYLADDAETETVTIEVLAEDLGDQIETEGARLYGITWDERSDTLDVRAEDVGHEIAHPTAISVIEDDDGFFSAVEVEREGEREILHLRRAQLPQVVSEPS